jgi:serine/threonine-protein kinase
MSDDLREHLQSCVGTAYQLERELGGGGMSRVFVARETALGRQVVLKVLTPELARGVSVERFRREILLAAKLQHPHIVPLLSAGQAGDLPYFAMPFVVGETLRMRIARHGELPISEAVRLLRHVASALAYAHEQGVVHRDIKPENVLLSSGVTVVTDFGVAKALTSSVETAIASPAGGGSFTPTTLTSLGLALGTPAYMAPEQATADPSMDHRVDIYAFGVLAYEALTGQPPFSGRSPQALLAAQVTEQPEPVERRRPAVPEPLGWMVMRCLEKHPADRPQSAHEIVLVLDALSTPSVGSLPTVQARVRSRTDMRRTRRRRQAAVAAAVTAGLAALLLFRQDYGNTSAEARETAQSAPAAVPRDAAPAPLPPAADSSAAPVAAPPPSAAPPSSRAEPARRAVPVMRPAPPSRRPVSSPATAMVAPPPAPAVREEPVPDTTPRDTAPRATAPETVVAGVEASEPPSEAPRPAGVPMPRPAPPAAPAPERPSTPPGAAASRAEIDALIARYGQAIESRSIAAIRRIHPSLSAAQQRDWETFFEAVDDVRVELRVTGLRQESDTAGTAVASVAGEYRYDNSSTRRTVRQPVRFEATLHHDPQGWRIGAIR